MFKISHAKDLLFILANMIALLTPAAYIIGVFFNAGGLAAYGLSQAEFPLDTTGVFESAFVYVWLSVGVPLLQFFAYIVQHPSYLILCVAIIFLLVFLLIKYVNNESWLKIKATKILDALLTRLRVKDTDIPRATKGTWLLSTYLGRWAYVAMVVTFLWVAVPALAYNKGKELNMTTLSKYQSQGCTRDSLGWSSCSTLRQHGNDEIIASGLLIAVNDERVALLSEGALKKIELTPERYMVREYFGIQH